MALQVSIQVSVLLYFSWALLFICLKQETGFMNKIVSFNIILLLLLISKGDIFGQ